MSKHLRVILDVPLTKEQAEVLDEVAKADFTSREWNVMVLGAIRSSALNENITVAGSEIVDDGDDVVLPEEVHAWPI